MRIWIAYIVVAGTICSAARADTKLDLTATDLSSVALAHGARTQKLVGSEIYARDFDVGTIDDVIVDLQSGKVRAVIVSINGLFHSRLVAVPSGAVKVGINDRLTIDATPDDLKAAPEFQYDDKSVQQ